MKKTSLLANASFLSIQEFVSQVLGVIFYIFMARYLGEFGLGIYSYLFTIVGISGQLIDFGVLSHYWRKWSSDRSEVSSDVGRIINSKILVIFPIFVLLSAYFIFFDSKLYNLFILAYAYIALDSVRLIPIYYFQSQNEFRSVLISNLIDRIGALIGGSILLYLGKGIFEILLLFVAIRIIATAISYKMVDFEIEFSKSSVRSLLAVFNGGAVLFFVMILHTFYFKVDNIMIRLMLGLDSVGLYNASYRIIDSLIVVPNILSFSVFSTFSSQTEKDNIKQQKELLNQLLKYSLLISIFVTVFFIFYANEILDFLYGNSFIVSGRVLSILGVGVVFIYFNTILSLYLVSQKKENSLIFRLVLITFFNIIANLFLISWWGVAGAAVTTLISEIIGFLILFKQAELSLLHSWYLKILFTAALLAIFLHFYHYPLFFTLIVSGMAYLGVNFVIKTVSLQEVKKLHYK